MQVVVALAQLVPSHFFVIRVVAFEQAVPQSVPAAFASQPTPPAPHFPVTHGPVHCMLQHSPITQ